MEAALDGERVVRALVLVLGTLGALLHAGSANAEDAARPFRYDAELRKCVNARGEEGLNPLPSRGADMPLNGECADYRGRQLMYLQLENGNFRGANFDGAQFRYLNFMARADLTGASLRDVVADVVDLREANLSGADLSGARLRPCPGPDRGACVQDARIDARTILPFPRKEAFARGMVAVDRSGAVPRFRYDAERGKCLNARGEEGLNQPSQKAPRESECADYRGVTLTYLRADGGNFRGAHFDGGQLLYLTHMARADFTGASLRGVGGDSLDLRGANFSGADLSGAHFTSCRENHGGVCLAGARFDARTILPFSREEALARGMVAVD